MQLHNRGKIDGIKSYSVLTGAGMLMRIGVPKEIKVLESRVGLTPASVRALTAKGWERACKEDPHLAAGVNVRSGELCVR